MAQQLVEPLAQFGVAGLMGLLWVWERRFSRTRERQLTEAHDQILHDRQALATLIELVRQNTAAISRFDQTLRQAIELLEKVNHGIHKNPS